jgi:hypothetical protein
MKVAFAQLLALTSLVAGSVARYAAQKIVLTNDDGWAVAQIRDEYNQLRAAGFEVSILFRLVMFIES